MPTIIYGRNIRWSLSEKVKCYILGHKYKEMDNLGQDILNECLRCGMIWDHPVKLTPTANLSNLKKRGKHG